MKRIHTLFLILALTITFACTTFAAERQVPPGLLRAAMVAQGNHTPHLLANPDVVGTAVGIERGVPVVKVLVKRLGVTGIPRFLDGFRTVPFVTGKIVALGKPGGVDRTARYRPAPIGVSTGHPSITAGTIGCRVKDQAGKVYVLSNNHVYADENGAKIGDNVLQPGPYDGGKDPVDSIGTLSDFEEISFETLPGEGDCNYIDAAIALSSPDLVDNTTPTDGYGVPESTTFEAVDDSIGMAVMKYGRTTGLTKGKIDSINATVRVSYDQGVAIFCDQIIITPGKFSAGGDSGSLIVMNDVTVVGKGKNATINPGPDHLKPVGLLFAGSSVVTIANRIQNVLDAFGVTIDGK